MREREIAQAENLLPLPNSLSARTEVVQRWWQTAQQRQEFVAVRADLDGRALDRARSAGTIILLLVGCLLGAAVSAAALHYDGSAPVNLVSVFAVLVVIPTLMLLLTLLLLPGRIRGLGWLQDVLASISPGQWFSAWLNRRYANADLGWRGRLSRTAALTDAAPGGYRTVAKWQLVLYAQMLALGFFLASLATILLLVTFSDMAFGWSTTLDVANARVVAWVSAIVAPWAHWLPMAVPDAQLIADSRFYRAAALSQTQVQDLGHWWPFLLATVVFYGLLPRLLLALLAFWRLRRSEQRMLLSHPQTRRLLERLSTPVVGHAVDVAETGSDLKTFETNHATMSSGDGDTRYSLPPGHVVLINWNDAVDETDLSSWLTRHFDQLPQEQWALGSQTGMAAEQQRLASMRADAIVVLTKSWEPPLLEFLDLTQRLKACVNNAGPVLLIPVGIAGANPTPGDLDIWRQTLARSDDVRVRLAEPVR
ncbi:MAG: DUF2868 domain-containing protein [Pseudomonadales bacterium]